MSATLTRVTPSDLWQLLTADKSTVVYELCDEWGTATGVQVIPIAQRGDRESQWWLCCSDSEGITLEDADDEDLLVPVGEYDDEEAQAAASNLEGWFGIVGLPGSCHHQFEWFPDREDAFAFVGQEFDATLRNNPALGSIESEVVSAAEAFGRKYRDGSRVYFQPRPGGIAGYDPKF